MIIAYMLYLIVHANPLTISPLKEYKTERECRAGIPEMAIANMISEDRVHGYCAGGGLKPPDSRELEI